MIDALLDFSIRQRLLVVVAAGLLVAGGLYALQALPIDAFPDVTASGQAWPSQMIGTFT